MDALLSFLNEHYLTLLLLAGTGVLLFVNRKANIPATRFFVLALVLVLIMAFADWGDKYCCELYDLGRPNTDELIMWREICSIITYVMTPLVLFLQVILVAPSFKWKWRLSIPAFLNAAVFIASPFLGELVFYISQNNHFRAGPLHFIIYAVLLFYMIVLLVISVRRLQQPKDGHGLIVLLLAVVTAVTIVLEAADLVTGYSTMVTAFGILVYYGYLLSIHNTNTAKELAKQQISHQQTKITLLQEQIHPHFVFNTLYVIKALVRREPERAVNAIDDFSDYLRSHIDVIRSDKPITFSAELEHVNAYLALEKADPSRDIDVEYDIRETAFSLPALSVQPIVENAVRHGLGRRGGHIKISTARTEAGYAVTVTDDGNGSDGFTETEKTRTGIGIKNVKTRLEMLCGGGLESETTEAGTRVTILIPTESRQK